MNGHDEETYERKDLPTAFISREEHEAILKEYNNYKVQAYEQLIELDKLREALKELIPIAEHCHLMIESISKIYPDSEKINRDGLNERLAKYLAAIENARKLTENK